MVASAPVLLPATTAAIDYMIYVRLSVLAAQVSFAFAIYCLGISEDIVTPAIQAVGTTIPLDGFYYLMHTINYANHHVEDLLRPLVNLTLSSENEIRALLNGGPMYRVQTHDVDTIQLFLRNLEETRQNIHEYSRYLYSARVRIGLFPSNIYYGGSINTRYDFTPLIESSQILADRIFALYNSLGMEDIIRQLLTDILRRLDF